MIEFKRSQVKIRNKYEPTPGLQTDFVVAVEKSVCQFVELEPMGYGQFIKNTMTWYEMASLKVPTSHTQTDRCRC